MSCVLGWILLLAQAERPGALEAAQEWPEVQRWSSGAWQRWQEFRATRPRLTGLDLHLQRGGSGSGEARIELVDAAGERLWQTRWTAPPNWAGWTAFDLDAVAVEPGARYRILLHADGLSWSGTRRFLVPERCSEEESGVGTAFDFAFRVWAEAGEPSEPDHLDSREGLAWMRRITPAALAWIEEHRGRGRSRALAWRLQDGEEAFEELVRSTEERVGVELAVARDLLAVTGLLPRGLDLEGLVRVAARFGAGNYVATYLDDAVTVVQEDFLGPRLLVHELIHAVDDEHFDLGRAPVGLDLDRRLAFQCLVEGNAEVWESLWRGVALERQRTRAERAARRREQARFAEWSLFPLVFRWLGGFPYERGPGFVLALWEEGGVEAIDGAFERPPSCTAQILHPELYLSGWEPVAASTAAAEEILEAAGWTRSAATPFGEFGLWLVLRQRGVEAADILRRTWRGDRLLILRRGEELGGLWRIACAGSEEAERLATAFRGAKRTRAVARGDSVLLLLADLTGDPELAETLAGSFER